mgnify:CR=1 FL=1
MKKKVAMFVCFVLLSSCLAPGVFALDEQHAIVQEEVTTRYEIISVITASLNISTSGRADCSASVRVPSGYKVELTAELQQKDGSKWKTIHDWEASGSNRISVSGPWYVMPGYSYRLKVTATTYDSNDNFVEAPVEYSNVEEY